MSAPVLIVVGAVAAKAVSVVWLASIATSPVAVASRKRFLQVNEEGLENMVKLGLGPDPIRLADLRADFTKLKESVEKGWDEPHLFAAALRISGWKFWAHVCGAGLGVSRLTANTTALATKAIVESANELVSSVNRTVDSIFAKVPIDKDEHGNHH